MNLSILIQSIADESIIEDFRADDAESFTSSSKDLSSSALSKDTSTFDSFDSNKKVKSKKKR